MKKILWGVGLLIAITVLPYFEAKACGHEGFFMGAGYEQLLQYSPDYQLVAIGTTSRKITWGTRWGAYAKVGYDFCGSRWGVEVPFSYNRQKLNRSELVNVMSVDANAIFHIIETTGGADFYWLGGLGGSYVSEGRNKNGTSATGMNFNFGPGFQYFLKQTKPKIAIGISVPIKYTLYFGNNLSRKRTSVFGIPIMAGFTVGF